MYVLSSSLSKTIKSYGDENDDDDDDVDNYDDKRTKTIKIKMESWLSQFCKQYKLFTLLIHTIWEVEIIKEKSIVCFSF